MKIWHLYSFSIGLFDMEQLESEWEEMVFVFDDKRKIMPCKWKTMKFVYNL